MWTPGLRKLRDKQNSRIQESHLHFWKKNSHKKILTIRPVTKGHNSHVNKLNFSVFCLKLQCNLQLVLILIAILDLLTKT